MSDRIDLNAASEDELVEVLGVDEATADRILEHRARTGGFKSLEELGQIEGVDAQAVRRLRDRLLIGVPVDSTLPT